MIMKEVLINVLVGSVILGAGIAVVQGVVYFPTLFGYTEKEGARIFFTLVGIYLTYVFGGITRSVYSNYPKNN